jgi:hypothetical protein
MTMRTVTPASGAAQLVINYDNGGSTVTAGQVLDVPPGSPLESALGLSNLTALTGTALANVQGGSDPAVTDNS